MPVFNNSLAGAAGSGGAAGYKIERSLRFNAADNAYLNRTPPTQGNRTTWTWSGWVKRTVMGADKFIFSAGADASNIHYLRFTVNDTLEITEKISDQVQYSLITSAVYRDPSAWYHIVYNYDSGQSTASDRLSLYVNGVKVSAFGTSTYPSQNHSSNINSQFNHLINARPNPAGYADQYLAEIHFVDGQALAATDFGEFSEDTGVWNPKEYSGTYGTHGFHLDFSDNSSNAALGYDAAGSNNWTVNNLTADGTGTAIRTSELSVNHASGSVYQPGNAFDATRIATYVNTSTWAITNTAWLGSYANGYAATRWIPAGGYAVSSSLRVYFGVYSNAAVSTTLTVTYTDNTTESSSQFTSGSNNWMTLFTASYAAGKTIQKVEISNPSVLNVQFGGFVIDDQIVTSLNADTDSFIDSPTNYEAASGNNGGNYCTLNPLKNQSQTLKNGNLESNGTSGRSTGTLYASSGKFYWEFTAGTSYTMSGIESSTSPNAASYAGENDQQYALYGNNGSGLLYHNGTTSSFDGFVSGDVIGVALDMDGGNLYFYKNGSAMNSGTAAATGLTGAWTANCRSGSGGYNGDTVFNFGQRPFKYTPPSGYKSLCTQNLDDPTITDPSTVFDVKLWTGNASTQTVSGLSFSPDLLWYKSRSVAHHHALQDTVRGVGKSLSTSVTTAESTETNGLDSFTADGFELDGEGYYSINRNNHSMVGWVWDAGSSTATNTDGSINSQVRANQSAGFSIVTWTRSGGADEATIGHGLNAVPELIILRDRDSNSNWYVGSPHLGGSPWLRYLQLNSIANYGQNSDVFQQGGQPTTSVFGVGAVGNPSGNNLAYCFAPVEGYSAFKSHTVGSGTNFVHLGFRPRFVMLKRTGAGSTTNINYASWAMFDTERDTYNEVDFDTILYANRSHD